MKSMVLLASVILAGCLLAVTAIAGSDFPGAPVKKPNSQAESLRTYFAEKSRIIDRGISTLSAFIDNYFSVQTPQACNMNRVEDNPPHVVPGIVGIYLIDMTNAEQLCASAPLRGHCQAIRRSCVAVENAIFCDVGFDTTMMLLSEAAYVDLFLWLLTHERDRVESNEERTLREGIGPMFSDPLPFPPLLRTETFIGVVNSAKHAEATGGRLDRFTRLVTGISGCHGSALAHMPLLMGVYGPVIAHEYAHVEDYACPAGVLQSPSDAPEAVDRYQKIACKTATMGELLADLRAVELLGEAPHRMMFDLARVGIGPLEHCDAERDPVPITEDLEDRIDWRIRSSYFALYATGLFVGAEYRTIVGKDLTRGIAFLSKQPQLKDGNQTSIENIKTYYRDVAYEQQRISTAGTTGLLGHMSEPFRVSLALRKDSQVLIARTFPVEKLMPNSGLFFYPGLRMEGLLRGNIEGLHETACRGRREECKRLGSEVVESTFPKLPKQ